MKFDESEALEKINDKIKELKYKKNQDILFQGFAEPYTNTRSTNVLLYDKDFNEAGKILCASFLHKGWSCRSLRYGKSAAKNRKYTLDGIKCIARDHVDKMNTWSNSDLSFLGIVENGETAANRIQLIIRCNKHNEICHPTFSKFMQKEHYCCPQCKILYPSFISAGEEKCYQEFIKYIQPKEIVRQYKIDNIYQKLFGCTKKYFLVDLCSPENNIAIEYDGIAHFEYKEHFYRKGGYRDFINQVNRDKTLEYHCRQNNIRLLRISYLDDSRIEEIIRAFILEGRNLATPIQPKLLPICCHSDEILGQPFDNQE